MPFLAVYRSVRATTQTNYVLMLGSMILLTPAPRKTMPRTLLTMGSTSSKSSAFGSVLAPSTTKMHETHNKMPSTLEQKGGN